MCAKSWDKAEIAWRYGKGNIRYCPIIIKFVSYLKSEAGNAAYSILADVFTLSSTRTIDSYSTLDSNYEDNILWDTLNDCQWLINDIVNEPEAMSEK